MDVTVVDPITNPSWRQLVVTRPTTLFHSPEWLSVLADTYSFTVEARVIKDQQGAPVAGMPYVTMHDFMDPRTGLPFSDFCDPLADTPHQWRALIDDLLAAPQRIDLRCLHNDIPLQDDRFTVVDRAMWHAIDVRRDEDTVWTELPGSARRALRKARSSRVEICAARDESDLRAFWELHVRVRKYKYGLLAQPFAFMRHIWDAFVRKDRGTLLLATIDGNLVAGVLFLEWQGVLYYKFNASDAAHLNARPNDLLLWEGIEFARKRGLDLVDFGLTDGDQEGLIRYKRKYATQEKPITLLRHQPADAPSAQDRMARSVLRDVTRLLTDHSVPDELSGRAGEVLYRYFT
jgi:CelD/BcsL family acetyltransferase involved in cellulose biosynthesis